MEGPGGEPPGTAAHRGSRGLREPPPSGLRHKTCTDRDAGASDGAWPWGSAELRDPRTGLGRGVQRGSGTLGRGSAAELRDPPAGLRCGAQPGSGNSRRDFAVGFSRATGRCDRALRWRSAGLRDAPTGIRRGAQPGSGKLRGDSAGRFSGVRDGAVLRGSAGLRDPPPGLSRARDAPLGFYCGAQPGCGARLRRDLAVRLSRAPGPAATSVCRGSAPLRCWAPGPSSGRHGSALGPGGLRRCLRSVPNGEERAAPCPPLPASPGTCPGPTSPGSEPSPASSSSSSSRRDTAPWGRGPLPCPPLPTTGAAAAGSSMELAAFYTGKNEARPLLLRQG